MFRGEMKLELSCQYSKNKESGCCVCVLGEGGGGGRVGV